MNVFWLILYRGARYRIFNLLLVPCKTNPSIAKPSKGPLWKYSSHDEENQKNNYHFPQVVDWSDNRPKSVRQSSPIILTVVQFFMSARCFAKVCLAAPILFPGIASRTVVIQNVSQFGHDDCGKVFFSKHLMRLQGLPARRIQADWQQCAIQNGTVYNVSCRINDGLDFFL